MYAVVSMLYNIFSCRYGIGMREADLHASIEEYIPPMLTYIQKYVSPDPSSRTGALKITAVTDIEETVWSPQ